MLTTVGKSTILFACCLFFSLTCLQLLSYKGMTPSQVSLSARRTCCLKRPVFYSTLEHSTHKLAHGAIDRHSMACKRQLMHFRELQVGQSCGVIVHPSPKKPTKTLEGCLAQVLSLISQYFGCKREAGLKSKGLTGSGTGFSLNMPFQI